MVDAAHLRRRRSGVHHRLATEQQWFLQYLRAPQLRTTLSVIVGQLFLIYVIDVCICLSAPCPFFEVGSLASQAAGLCVEEYELILTIRLLGYLVCLGAAAIQLIVKAATVLRFSRSTKGGCCCTGRSESRGDCSWVCAASPDLYQESLNSLRAGNILLGITTVPVTICLVATYLVVGLQHNRSPLFELICGTSQLCYMGKRWNEMIERAVLQMWGAASVHFVTTPTVLWGDAMTTALRQKGNPLLHRLKRAPYLVLISFVIVLYQNVHREMRDVPNSTDSGPDVAALFVIEVVSFLFHLYFVWNSMLVQDMAAFLGVSAGHFFRQARRAVSRPSIARRFSSTVSVDGSQASATIPAAIRVLKESSTGHRQELLIMVFALVMCYRVASGVPIGLCVVVYAGRATLAVLIVLLRDKESSFDHLHASPGFGLVVKASALHASLLATIDGRPYTARLPRYKATAERMEETMAVSYRWQTVEMCISHDCMLNMSTFQLKALAVAIKEQRCRYVWLDRLSVPQHECELKYTLLARMMAVYASAKATLALRSLEAPGSRYHERVWTCQEFCIARKLNVVTQPRDIGDAMEHGLGMAVSGEEGQEMEELRERMQMAGAKVMPLWLRETPFEPAVAKAALAKYCKLSGKLRCHTPADKIRALLPLVTRAPVEGQGELIQLVLVLGRASGEDLQELKGHLLEQHLSLKTATRATLASKGAVSIKRRLDQRRSSEGASLHRSHSVMDHSMMGTFDEDDCEGVLATEALSRMDISAEHPRPRRSNMRKTSSAINLSLNGSASSTPLQVSSVPPRRTSDMPVHASMSFSVQAARAAWVDLKYVSTPGHGLAIAQGPKSPEPEPSAEFYDSDPREIQHSLAVIATVQENDGEPLLPGQAP